MSEAGKEEIDSDKDMASQDASSSNNGVIMECRRVKREHDQPTQANHGNILETSKCLRDQGVLLYSCLKKFQRNSNLATSELDGAEDVGPWRFQLEPQAVVDLSPGKLIACEPLTSSLETIKRPGVIVAADSSSTKIDYSFHEEYNNKMHYGYGCCFPNSASLMMYPPVKQEATPENFVSSSSDSSSKRPELLKFNTIKLTPFALKLKPGEFVRYSTTQTNLREDKAVQPTMKHFADSSMEKRNRSDNSTMLQIGYCGIRDFNRNYQTLMRNEIKGTDAGGMEYEDVGGDEEDIAEILNDETDTAEEDFMSEDEMTDSASETEAILKKEEGDNVKPVITIRDQDYPRLVIDFRNNHINKVLEVGTTTSLRNRNNGRTIFPNSVIDNTAYDYPLERSKSGNEMDSKIPIGNSRRFKKRKRIDFSQKGLFEYK